MKRAPSPLGSPAPGSWSRREFIKAGGAAGLLGAVSAPTSVAAKPRRIVYEARPSSYESNIYTASSRADRLRRCSSAPPHA